MDSRLDRYISNEYLVSPCPEAGRNGGGEDSTLLEIRTALDRAKESIERLRNSDSLDENATSLLNTLEKEITRASSLLENPSDKSWLA